jgi:hypothetical protein
MTTTIAADMRHTKDKQVDIEEQENFGYAVGEARDYLDRAELEMLDILSKVEEGRLSFVAARFAIRLHYRAPRKDLEDWRKWWGWRATERQMPYLHDSVKIARVLVRLPEETA